MWRSYLLYFPFTITTRKPAHAGIIGNLTLAGSTSLGFHWIIFKNILLIKIALCT